METTENNNISEILSAGAALAEMTGKSSINGTPVVLLPKEYQLRTFTELRDFPQFTKQHVRHSNAESFINYFKKFCTNESAIFFNKFDEEFTAIIDYHSESRADNCYHVSSFKLLETPEWSSWKKSNGAKMNQNQFAEFIETNLEEIITPPGAEMLEIATSMQFTSSAKFGKSIKLQNGQVQFEYVEDINGTAGAKGQLTIPSQFVIGLKMFEGAEAYQITANLRTRINNGVLTIWYELVRPHKTVDANTADTIEYIKSKVNCSRFYNAQIKK